MLHLLHHLVLAATPSPGPTGSPNPSPTAVPIDPNKVQAGAIGLMFFAAMGLAVAVLVMSMRRHLGRVDVTRHERERGAKAGRRKNGTPPAT